MKHGLRVLGLDDGPFNKFTDIKTVIVGVIMRLNYPVEGISVREITVDGMDSTEIVMSMIRGRFRGDIDFVMCNGITFAGFNILDIQKVYSKTGIPVIAVTRKNPSIEKISRALLLHFKDSEERIKIITETPVDKIGYGDRILYINRAGIELNRAVELIKNTVNTGNIPEPVRMAHLIATAIINKESHGRV
ncbi:MAG: DUF99 family protein [Ferroplasma sp.]|uniref:endonuclease dU n=1 Tax=Ferroplasma sp. TaxID=2591003 RepID=UPI002815E8C0|nr:DUF99 family protein [Ferroplasma sp.]WMT51602.1 MAG: DUF99 family protein [Ferroplasma sp.]